MDKFNNKNEYIRVQTTYYKKVRKPLSSGDTIEQLVPWNIETIKADHGKDFIADIPKFNGFCCIPSHTNYQKVIPPIKDENEKIHGFYNEYNELDYIPKPGDCEFTLEFIKHIFQDQENIALDYLTLLYKEPTHLQYVICLVSNVRGTGKTTFLNWIKAIFGKNATLNTNSDFRSQFNSDWANKLIVAVDEVLLDKVEDTERIKNLSTAKTFKAEAKGKDRSEIEFFGKFILCSNNEFNFIKIDPEETRFWVRKVPTFDGILKDNLNNLLDILISEIPAFLDFLSKRPMIYKKVSRMWFDPKDIETEALKRVKFSNRSRMEREIVNYIKVVMEIENVDRVFYSAFDITKLLQNNYSKADLSGIKYILKNKWSLKQAQNSYGYTRFTLCPDGTVHAEKAKGRYYEFEKTFFIENFDDFDDE